MTNPFSALLDDLRAVLPAASPVIVEGATTSISQASLRGDVEHVRRAIAALPNTSNHFPTRESYLAIGFALRAALPDEPDEALDLFQDWCARWTDGHNDPEVVEADWRRMKAPFRRGAGWLFDLAAEHGDFDRASVWFEPVVDESPLWTESQPKSEKTDTRPALRAGRVNLDDLKDLPPRQWLYGYKVLRKYVTFIASPGGVGKTAMTFAMALACAANKALLHDEPRARRPLRVWLFNLEDDIIELRRRLLAAVKFYDLPPETLEFIRLNSGRDRGVKIVKIGKDGAFMVQPDVAEIIRIITEEGIDLVIFDPFLRTHGVPENENEAQDEVMRLFAHIAEQTNCGIVLVHHTKKGAVAGDLDSMRGGSTQGGGARAAFTLAPMSSEEAGRLGIPEGERRRYVRMDDAKSNMAPPSGKAEWLKLESYRIGNATEDYPLGDNVQVAAKWTPPDAWDGVAGQDDAVLARIDAGTPDGERYSARAQDDGRWAGDILVEDLERTPAQAKEIIAAWVKSGVLEVQSYRSPTQRKDRKGLFLAKKATGVFD